MSISLKEVTSRKMQTRPIGRPSATTEEAKTEVLDISRKSKEQQDAIDQMRDQLDRTKQELIQVKARQDAVTAPPAPSSK